MNVLIIEYTAMSLSLTQENFQSEVLDSQNVVLVDFWAEWCGPCKMMGPIVDELFSEYTGTPVTIAKLNVDEYPEIAQQYEITSIPTFKIFKGGKVVDQFMGSQAKDAIKSKIAAARA